MWVTAPGRHADGGCDPYDRRSTHSTPPGHILAGPRRSAASTGVDKLWKSPAGKAAMIEIWTSILKQIEGKLDAKELKTWFGPTRQLGFSPDAEKPLLTVSVP